MKEAAIAKFVLFAAIQSARRRGAMNRQEQSAARPQHARKLVQPVVLRGLVEMCEDRNAIDGVERVIVKRQRGAGCVV